MYSAAGNQAVATMLAELKAFAQEACAHCQRRPTESELRESLHNRMQLLSRKHGEVYDTEVRAAIYFAVKPIWEELHYDPHTLDSEL